MPASAKPRVTRATCSTETPFFISASNRSEATSSPPVTAMQPLSAKLLGERRREGLLEADVAPPGDGDAAALELRGERAQPRRRSLSTKWKPVWPGLGDDGLDAVDQRGRVGRLVARDVVEAGVAEAALLPVAAVRHGELVPAPVAPQPVHGVEHVQQREVARPAAGRPRWACRFPRRGCRARGSSRSAPALHPPRSRARSCAPGARARAPSFEMLDERQQRALAAVQRDRRRRSRTGAARPARAAQC